MIIQYCYVWKSNLPLRVLILFKSNRVKHALVPRRFLHVYGDAVEINMVWQPEYEIKEYQSTVLNHLVITKSTWLVFFNYKRFSLFTFLIYLSSFNYIIMCNFCQLECRQFSRCKGHEYTWVWGFWVYICQYHTGIQIFRIWNVLK